MAYLRGDCYLWSDSDDRLHIWVRGGQDDWQDSVWAEGSPTPDADAGVSIPESVMDRFVLMRFAELVADRRAAIVLDEVCPDLDPLGNAGEAALRANRDLIRAALVKLEAKSRGSR